jgi:signal transduction histidine kinase
MSMDWFNKNIRSGDWAVLVVVLAGFVMYFSSGIYQMMPVSPVLLSLLGVTYLAICIWGSHTLQTAQPVQKDVFFASAFLVGATINYLTNGGTWIILLPLVSDTIQQIPSRLVSSIYILAIWIVDTLPTIRVSTLPATLSAGMAYLSAIIFVAVITSGMVREQKFRRELSAANDRLRQYTHQVEANAILEERNRLAREIHDGLGHYLTTINIQLKAAQAVLQDDPKAAMEAINKAQVLSQDALADVRRSVSSLRTDQPAGQKASQAISVLLDGLEEEGLSIAFRMDGEEIDLPPQIVFTLYRISQEALTNIKKHSLANRVEISLTYQPDQILLQISDNGVGIDPDAIPQESRYGLVGLQERVRMLGGKVEIDSQPGKGFSLLTSIPFQRPVIGRGITENG